MPHDRKCESADGRKAISPQASSKKLKWDYLLGSRDNAEMLHNFLQWFAASSLRLTHDIDAEDKLERRVILGASPGFSLRGAKTLL